jgi:hypothetical protein
MASLTVRKIFIWSKQIPNVTKSMNNNCDMHIHMLQACFRQPHVCYQEPLATKFPLATGATWLPNSEGAIQEKYN